MENLPPIDNYPDSQQIIYSQRLLVLYLIPVIGFFPSLWSLYQHQGSREQLAVNILSITLAFTWMSRYLLATGAATSDCLTRILLILNSFPTSGYFLVNIWLIFRVIKKSIISYQD